MARFQLDIEKLLGAEYWTNVYYLEADSLAAAVSGVAPILAAERQITMPDVLFTKYRVRTTVEGDDVYVTTPINELGVSNKSGTLLPLFNTLNVVFGATSGRPSRKYYRGVLTEATINFNTVDGTMANDAKNSLQTALTALDVPPARWVDIDGQDLVNVSVSTLVGMRQLRRGSKRRQNPVIP